MCVCVGGGGGHGGGFVGVCVEESGAQVTNKLFFLLYPSSYLKLRSF